MNTFRKAIFITLIASLVAMAWMRTPVTVAASPLEETSTPYGYVVDDGVAFQWVDASAGETLVFDSPDDDAAGPVSLGFSFPFFDGAFDAVYVSTNGFLTFGEASIAFTNQAIPRDVPPNGLIAPFWDDLTLLSDQSGNPVSRVSILRGSDAEGNFAAIEWYQVAKLGTSDYLSFEVILRENGDVLIQYQTLDGIVNQATVGMEGPDGIYGVQYLYNQAGLTAGKAIRFNRPAAGARVKFLAPVNGVFLQNGTGAVIVPLKNSGAVADRMDISLEWLDGATNWTANLWNVADHALLQDTDGNGTPDTGMLSPGASLDILVEILAPKTAAAGDFYRFQLVASSQTDAAQKSVSLIQAAIPEPFAQVSFSDSTGVQLYQVWERNAFTSQAYTGQFTGTNMAVFPRTDGGCLVSWERNFAGNAGLVANVEYAIFSPLGVRQSDVRTLYDNTTAETRTEDRYVNMASLPNGSMAVVWKRILRRVVGAESQLNENIYFAILNPDTGQFTVAPIDVTQNTEWRGASNGAAPIFPMLRIATSGNSTVLLVWQENRRQETGITDDLYGAVYDFNGTLQSGPFQLTDSAGTGNHYAAPALVPVSNNRLLLAYSISTGDATSETAFTVAFRVLNANGTTQYPETVLSADTDGLSVDGVRLDNGRVVLAWHSTSANEVVFAVLDGETYAVLHAAERLSTPKGRIPSEVSVTQGRANHALITWYETEEQHYFNYVLVDSSGAVLTPPMQFIHTSENSVFSNTYGFGNAPFDGALRIALPLIQR